MILQQSQRGDTLQQEYGETIVLPFCHYFAVRSSILKLRHILHYIADSDSMLLCKLLFLLLLEMTQRCTAKRT